MRRRMMVGILACQLLACTISGCGYYKDEAAVETETEEVDLTEQYYDSSEQVAYEKPTATVHILVDQAGYEPEDKKRVVFIGEELSDVFSVYKKDTKEVVYTGSIIKKGFDSARNDYVWEGDFTDVKEPGSYYIATEKLGQSYAFEIGINLYQQRSEEVGKEISSVSFEKSDQFMREDCFAISNLLLSYELYGVSSDEEAYFASIQNYLDKWLAADNLSKEDRQFLAGLLAQFANTYKAVDQTATQTYLTAAKGLFQKAELLESEETYFAAAQLYKASGEKSYQTIAEAFLQKGQQNVSENALKQQQLCNLGDIAYITTAYKVDQKLCERIMDQLLSKGEVLSSEAGVHVYRITAGEQEDKLYENMLTLAIVDYAIVSHEYLTLLKEDVHYLYGKGSTLMLSEHSVLEQTYIYFIMRHIAERKETSS